jgi:hypothetical protein
MAGAHPAGSRTLTHDQPVAAGVEGNRRLTAALGAVLLVLLAVEGGTIPFLSQLEVVHVVVGLVLIPIVLLKMATTFYRFARYYSGQPDYRQAGPPPLVLRAVGPLVVLTSLALFASGVVLAAIGRHSSSVYAVHKVSFIAWFGAMSVHVLGHLAKLPSLAVRDWIAGGGMQRSTLRRVAVVAVTVTGIVIAAIIFPVLPSWSGGR